MYHSRIRHLTLIQFFLLTSFTVSTTPNNNEYSPKIIAYDNINDGLGSYSFRFETSDGTRRSEQGKFETDPVKGQVYRVKGSYSYIGPDFIIYTVEYTADENGFHPVRLPAPSTTPTPSTTPVDFQADLAPAALPPDVISSLLG